MLYSACYLESLGTNSIKHLKSENFLNLFNTQIAFESLILHCIIGEFLIVNNYVNEDFITEFQHSTMFDISNYQSRHLGAIS